MEARLLSFITSVQSLSDIRNLDQFNPIIFQLAHPMTSTIYQVAGAKVEPSYLGFPINGTWVVLDPTSQYYLKALKLKDVRNPDTVSTLPAVMNGNAWWHVVRTYDEIFSDPQYYTAGTTIKGDKGDKGDPGDPGAAGPAGPAPDISAVVSQTLQRMNSYAGTLTINGQASAANNSTVTYTVSLSSTVLDASGNPTTVVADVPAQVVVRGSNGHAYVDANNVLHVSGVTATENIVLQAIWPSWGTVLIAEKTVALASATPVSLVINGNSTVFAGQTLALTATATFSDSTTATVVPTYSVDVGGTMTGSNFVTAGPISANINATVSAALNLGGVNLSATKAVTVQQVVATALTINGPNTVLENATANYTATVTYNTGATAVITPMWSSSSIADATISTLGVMNANEVAADTPVTLTARFTAPSSTAEVVATKVVTVTNIAPVVNSFYGTGPALPANWQTFVTGLAYSGTGGDLVADFSIDMIGASTFGYYVYPVAYGLAQFFDPLSNFTGGWGGAGNPSGGASAASEAAGTDTPITENITINGVSVPCYIYRTDNANMGAAAANRWVVQHKL